MIELTPKRLFVLLGVTAALAIIAFRGQSLLRERESLLEQRASEAQSLARFASTYSARLYDQSARLADDVAVHLSARPDPATLHDYLAAKVSDTSADDYIVVLDAEGRVIATSEAQTPVSMSYGSEGFQERMQNGGRRINPVMRSRITDAVIYSLSTPFYDKAGQFAGVVGVNVKPEGIRAASARKPADPLLTVWSRQGDFIAATFVDFDANGAAIAPPKPAGVGIPGSDKAPDPGALVSALPVTGWPLVAVAAYDRSGVLQPWRQSLVENIVLVGLMIMGLGVLVLFGVRTAEREDEAKAQLVATNELANSALQERDLLLKEIHHRVKNSLTMTAGLISLQEREFTDPQVREAFEGTRRRLHSIGLVHEALYSGSSSGDVDLETYLRRLTDDLDEAYGGKARKIAMTLEVEPIRLGPTQVTPVGLIVAEVVTNAFKYAFGPDGGGEIRLRARRLGPDEIEIEVRDNGVGMTPESAPSGTGLGGRLIQALTTQLGGVLSISNEGGAAFRLTFPAL